MKALVGAFNQEKALVGAFSVIVQPVVEPMEHCTALPWSRRGSRRCAPAPGCRGAGRGAARPRTCPPRSGSGCSPWRGRGRARGRGQLNVARGGFGGRGGLHLRVDVPIGGAGGGHLKVASVPGLGLDLAPAAGGAVAAAAPLEAVEAGARAAAAAGLAPGGRVGLLALLAIQQRLRGR